MSAVYYDGPSPMVMPAPVPLGVPQPYEKMYPGRRTAVGSRTYYIYPDGTTSDMPPPSRVMDIPPPPPPRMMIERDQIVRAPLPPPTTVLTKPSSGPVDPQVLSPLHAAESEISRLVSERDTLLNDNRRLHQELINARSACATHVHYGQAGDKEACTAACGGYADEHNALKQRCRQLELERDDLQSRLRVAEANPSVVRTRDNAGLLAEMDDLRKERMYLQNELARSEDTLRSLQKTMSRNPPMSDPEVNDLINSERAAREELARLQKAFDTMRAEQNSLLKITDDLRNAEKEISLLTQDRDQLEEALQQAQTDFDELSTQFNALTATAVRPTSPVPAIASSAAASVTAAPVPMNARPVEVFSPEAAQPIGVGRRKFPPSFEGTGNAIAIPLSAAVQQQQQAVYTSPVKPRATTTNAADSLCCILGMQVTVQANSLNPEDGIVEISAIGAGSLAERSGLRLGDIVEKWNRKVILSVADWESATAGCTPGSTIRVGVMRTGTRKQIMINLPQ